MASLKACPRCGRKVKPGPLNGNWFPVHTCRDCGTKSCNDCGGTTCPKCRSGKYSTLDKVYG